MAKKIRNILKYILPVIGIAAAAAYIIFSPQELTEERTAAELESGKFLDGISVAGTELGGKTYAEARELLREREQEILSEVYIELKHGDERFRLGAEDFSVQINTEEVLRSALLLGKSGSEAERYRVRKKVAQGKDYALVYTLGEVDEACIEEICAEIDRAPENASMKFTASENFTYVKEKDGVEVKQEELLRLLNDPSAGMEIEIPTRKIRAEVTMAELREKTVLRAKFATSFAKEPYNNPNRVANIKKSVKLFNESDKNVLSPGEKLSLNEVLGDRTEAGGWKLAPGYVRGKTEDQPGGGVCQVSTTLYCAALKADLEIVERSNHSIPVGYAEQGTDATISTGGPDLVIRNNTKDKVYLRAWLSAEQKLYFEIYGLPFEGFDSIGIETEKLREIEPEGEMQVIVDETMTVDEEEIVVKRRTGSEWETFKCYQTDGKVIKRVSAGKSIYKAFAGEKIVGTS